MIVGMKYRFPIAAGLVLAGMCAHAHETGELTRKSIASASMPAAAAPFAGRSRDPLPELMLRAENERRVAHGGCDQAVTDLCYDALAGRVVYRAGRHYMPRIQGLTPESVSVRHDRVVFRYSF
jgi:hypothetical protein